MTDQTGLLHVDIRRILMNDVEVFDESRAAPALSLTENTISA
jgi:hypothetical protein